MHGKHEACCAACRGMLETILARLDAVQAKPRQATAEPAVVGNDMNLEEAVDELKLERLKSVERGEKDPLASQVAWDCVVRKKLRVDPIQVQAIVKRRKARIEREAKHLASSRESIETGKLLEEYYRGRSVDEHADRLPKDWRERLAARKAMAATSL